MVDHICECSQRNCILISGTMGRWDDPLDLYANLLHDFALNFALYSKTLQTDLIPS